MRSPYTPYSVYLGGTISVVKTSLHQDTFVVVRLIPPAGTTSSACKRLRGFGASRLGAGKGSEFRFLDMGSLSGSFKKGVSSYLRAYVGSIYSGKPPCRLCFDPELPYRELLPAPSIPKWVPGHSLTRSPEL